MQIKVAKRGGFCFGVKRAVDMTRKLTEKVRDGVYTLGPLIHNPQMVEKLALQGVNSTDDIHASNIKVLIIRTHGVSSKIYAEALKMGYKVVDATCPFVKKAQQYAQLLKQEKYQVLLVGDKNHPEVQAMLDFAGDNVITVSNSEPVPALKSRVGIIIQTTQDIKALERVVCESLGYAKELKIYNTICDSTALRLREAKKIAKAVDLMIVVGGKNSANTTQLANFSKGICGKVYHIETADEIQDGWLDGVKKVGITGGASTPQWIIDGVVEKLQKISPGR